MYTTKSQFQLCKCIMESWFRHTWFLHLLCMLVCGKNTQWRRVNNRLYNGSVISFYYVQGNHTSYNEKKYTAEVWFRYTLYITKSYYRCISFSESRFCWAIPCATQQNCACVVLHNVLLNKIVISLCNQNPDKKWNRDYVVQKCTTKSWFPFYNKNGKKKLLGKHE